MLERFVNQEAALVTYSHEHGFPGTTSLPSKFEFGWLRQLVELLAPAAEATQSASAAAAAATAATSYPCWPRSKLQQAGVQAATLKN